jgi:small-conductance mechanosensitive channel
VHPNVRVLLATELVCILAWALTGEGFALVAALVAGLGLVAVALGTEDRPSHQRRVR